MCPRSPLSRRSSLSEFNRREWIKVFLLGTAASSVLGSGRASAQKTILTGLAPGDNDSAIIRIRISDFPILQVAGGSVAISFSTRFLPSERYPIQVTRGDTDAPDEFFAVDPTCTHMGCEVGSFSTSTFDRVCPCHYSVYNIRGEVIQGAVEDQANLPTFPTAFDGVDLVEVELTGVPLRIDAITVQSQTALNTRLRLQFPGTSGCKYRVNYRADLDAAPQPVLFATTVSGAASEEFLTVPDFGDGDKSVWVDSPGNRGFFTVELVTVGTALPPF